MTRRWYLAAFFTGIIAGGIDILLAMGNAYLKNNNVTPDKVLIFISSGIFGKNAFNGGVAMILFGLLAHFIIAIIFSAILYFLYPKLNLGNSNKLLTGILYGIIIWCVMNLLVVPISRTPTVPFNLVNMVVGMIILIVAIGLPVVYFAGKFYSKRRIKY